MSDYSYRDYVLYRMGRARDTIEEVKLHIDNGLSNTAINRMYYACYYAVTALLASEGIEVSSHAGVRQKFGERFIKTSKLDIALGRHFSELYEKRQKGDYNDFFDHEEELVLRLYPISQKFIADIDKLISKLS